MQFLLILAILLAVVLFVSAPLRRAGAGSTLDRDDGSAAAETERAELEAARDAKYREIRDAELDYRTGKLSEADWQELDGSLRAEAVEILHALDGAPERQPV
jgi:hypothetical protein